MPNDPDARIELELLREGHVARVIRLDGPTITLGRDLANTVVMLDEDVSCNHAVLRLGTDGLRLRDLRSTNGTFLNDTPVAADTAVADGDVVRLGATCALRVRRVATSRDAVFALADLTAGTIHPLDGDRCVFGNGPACQVEIPDGPTYAAALSLADGEAWLDAEVGGGPIQPGATFEVAGHRFRLEALEHLTTPITQSGTLTASPSYVLAVGLDAPGGPVAQLSDPRGTIHHTVGAENRATLLYMLARRRKEDLDRGDPETTAGWIDDEDVLIGVWGRAALHQATSNWSVLLHRLRRELEEAGFDSSIIEKRRGAVRIRLRNIELGGQPAA